MNRRTALIIAPHPDDAEIAMGGTIAMLSAARWNVIVADLTDGEPTPFGTKEKRALEARRAAAILGITERLCLDMPNRCLESTLDNRKKIARIIRLKRPDLLFAPAADDWHPDHVAATRLVANARFQAKYHKTDMPGKPYWAPQLVHYYSPHRNDYPSPSFIVNISDQWQVKEAAIRAYESQLKNSNGPGRPNLVEKVENVARYFGQCISSDFGEPFKSCQPLSVDFGPGDSDQRAYRCTFRPGYSASPSYPLA